MSVTRSTTEKFEELMESVPSDPFRSPVSMQECKESKVKTPPLSEAKKKIVDADDSKKKAKSESKKSLTEAAEKIADIYTSYILEGALDDIKNLNPEHSAKIESLKTALAEAAQIANGFLV